VSYSTFERRASLVPPLPAHRVGVEVLEVRHGVQNFDMKIPDASAGRWQEMVETTLANRDRWKAEEVSPTFAANQSA